LLFIAEHARESFVLTRGGSATSKQLAFHRGRISWLVKPEFQKKFIETIENIVKEDTTKTELRFATSKQLLTISMRQHILHTSPR